MVARRGAGGVLLGDDPVERSRHAIDDAVVGEGAFEGDDARALHERVRNLGHDDAPIGTLARAGKRGSVEDNDALLDACGVRVVSQAGLRADSRDELAEIGVLLGEPGGAHRLVTSATRTGRCSSTDISQASATRRASRADSGGQGFGRLPATTSVKAVVSLRKASRKRSTKPW